MRMPKDKPPLSAKRRQDAARVDRRRAAVGSRLHVCGDAITSRRCGRGGPSCRRPSTDATNPVDRILDAYLARSTKSRGRRRSTTRRSCAACISTSSACCRRPTSCTRFWPDNDPAKREQVIDELLADNRRTPSIGCRSGTTCCATTTRAPATSTAAASRSARWLYRALLENKPFDQFVRELIAPSPESEGFIRGIKWRGNVNASQKPELQFAQNVSQVFLGMNMKCASCHDSFIDRWKLAETYGLAAIYADGPLEMYRCDKPTGKMAEAAWMFPELGQIDPSAPRGAAAAAGRADDGPARTAASRARSSIASGTG